MRIDTAMKDDEPESALHVAMSFLPRCLETSQPTAELRDDILSFSIDRIYKVRSYRIIASFNQYFSRHFLRCLANSVCHFIILPLVVFYA